MNKAFCFLVLGVLCLALSPLRADGPARKVSAEEQAVMEALLMQSMPKPTKQRLLLEEAQPLLSRWNRQHLDEWRRIWPNEPQFKEALDDYVSKNDVAAKMVFPRPFSNTIQVISVETFDRLVQQAPHGRPSWPLMKQYPELDGLKYVSRPGFDSHHTMAIIGMADDSHGQFYYLEKNGAKWVLTPEMLGPSWDTDY